MELLETGESPCDRADVSPSQISQLCKRTFPGRIITEECTTTYLQSFISVNNFIAKQGLIPEELSIEMHATDNPATGHHIGRYHLPNAPEIALSKDINPSTGFH